MIRKSHQRHFLKRFRKFCMSANISLTFHRSTNESLLMGCIRVWYESCSANSRKSLQRLMEVAENITGSSFLPLRTSTSSSSCKAHSIITDHSHPAHQLFCFLRQMAQGCGCIDHEIIEQGCFFLLFFLSSHWITQLQHLTLDCCLQLLDVYVQYVAY